MTPLQQILAAYRATSQTEREKPVMIDAQDSCGQSSVIRRIRPSELREVDLVLIRCPGLSPFYPIIEIANPKWLLSCRPQRIRDRQI